MSCNFDNDVVYEKWDIVSVNFGLTTNLINENDIFDKEKLFKNCGINIRYEFSFLHMGVVISPVFLNKDNKVLIIPITTFNPKKHNENYINNFVLYKKYYKNLENDSVMLLNEVRSVDISRITKKHYFHLKDSHKKIIKEKLYEVFIGKNINKMIIEVLKNDYNDIYVEILKKIMDPQRGINN